MEILQFHQAMNTASQQLHQLQKQVLGENYSTLLMIPLLVKMKLMVVVQQVEREGKMLTKAALTMPQVNKLQLTRPPHSHMIHARVS